MPASSYLALLAICGFFSATWLASKVSRTLGMSTIVLEIATGVALGPRVLSLVNTDYAVCQSARHTQCRAPPDLLQRLAEGSLLGKDLGRIASMGYCDPEVYLPQELRTLPPAASPPTWEPSGAEGRGAQGAENQTGLHKPQATARPNVGQEEEEEQHGDGTRRDGHGEDPTEGRDEAAATPSPSLNLTSSEGPDHAEDQHRRLSNTGAIYASYEECLAQSCEQDLTRHCQVAPDIFTLVGHMGVALMLFESGMFFHFHKAADLGLKGLSVAALGSLLPLVMGSALTMCYGKPFYPHGVAVGIALAPTSLGMALRILGEAGVLHHDFAQAIVTTALVDDLMAMTFFSFAWSFRGEFDALQVIVLPLVGIAFAFLAIVAATRIWPWVINDVILPRIPAREPPTKLSSQDEALLVVMVALLIAYATATHFLSTHLWGCFLAGMSFACVQPLHHPHRIWVNQTKRFTSWMVRIFFACTVAFSLPVDRVLSFDSFWKGVLMGVGPGILTKVFSAQLMGEARFLIGWAMVGRAEFAYLIAQMGVSVGMMDEDTFAILIWALLCATAVAPLAFRIVLTRYIAQHGIEVDDHAAGKGNLGEEGVADEGAAPQDVPAPEVYGKGSNTGAGKAQLDPEQPEVYGKRHTGIRKTKEGNRCSHFFQRLFL